MSDDFLPFDRQESERRKQEGMDRAEFGARDWIDRAHAAAVRCARLKQYFTTDDVWRLFGEPEDGTEPKAMGPLMVGLKRKGIAVPTSRWELSDRVACHRRPVRVWESKVFTNTEPTDAE